MNPKQTPPGLLSAQKLNLPCVKGELFFCNLEEEMARAFRYQFFVSLILFRTSKDQHAVSAKLARFLRQNIRRNDCVGLLENRTFGVILLNSKVNHCLPVMQRLQSDFLFSVSKEHPDVELKASHAVYPSEAENLKSLQDLALKRLRAQKYTDLTIFLISPPAAPEPPAGP